MQKYFEITYSKYILNILKSPFEMLHKARLLLGQRFITSIRSRIIVGFTRDVSPKSSENNLASISDRKFPKWRNRC